MRRARDGNHVGKKEQLEIAYRRIRQMTHRVLQYGNIQFITSLEFKLTYSCKTVINRGPKAHLRIR